MRAQSSASAPAAEIPQVTDADLDYATRMALAQGVITLKKFAQEDPQGWIIPPIQKVTLTGYKDVPLKYRLIERDVPIYEYTDLVVLTPGPSPGDPPVRRIVQQPTKQIGTRKETHIRYDPTGPLERIYKQPIYEHVGDTSWSYSLIGDSAMALTALRAAGLPENDPVVTHMVENILLYLDTYGPPDQTWNLAWLAVAMAQTDDSIASDWTEKLASRLLDGQITDGAARGLWGPMCFHPRLISVLISDYLASDAEVSRMQAKQKERPTKANQVLLSQAEGARNRLKKYADTWSHLGLKFATAEFPLIWEDMMTEKVQFAGATDFFYNQRSADMESTWVALHALSVCAEMKRLPKVSLRTPMPAAYDATRKIGATVTGPKGSSAGSQLNETTVPPEASMAVLARAANALGGCCQRKVAGTNATSTSPSKISTPSTASSPCLRIHRVFRRWHHPLRQRALRWASPRLTALAAPWAWTRWQSFKANLMPERWGGLTRSGNCSKPCGPNPRSARRESPTTALISSCPSCVRCREMSPTLFFPAKSPSSSLAT
jgi:hypothetical protein